MAAWTKAVLVVPRQQRGLAFVGVEREEDGSRSGETAPASDRVGRQQQGRRGRTEPLASFTVT